MRPGRGGGIRVAKDPAYDNLRGMRTSTREFLREFVANKAMARRGETVRIKDRQGEYVFTAVSAERKSLLGCARGKVTIDADITAPTLPGSTHDL